MFKLDVKKNGKIVHQVGGSSQEDCLTQLQPYFEHKTFGNPETTETILVSEAIPEVRDEEGNVIQEAVEAVYETVITPAEYEILIIDISEQVNQQKINSEALAYLASTDFKVLRHIRQQALGETTSLTQEEYLMLEQERSDAANRIIKIVD